MADYLFVSQTMLDNWMEIGKIDFQGHLMKITGDKRAYRLEPAVRFVAVVGDDPDVQGLIGKVKTLEQVTEASGEHYADSVILDDTAYEVQNGFIARVSMPENVDVPETARADGVEPVRPPVTTPITRPVAPPAAPAPAPVATPAPVAAGATEGEQDEKSDEELLTDFLLKHLN